MIAQLTGTRDGEDWPKVGTVIDIPDAEAADLVMNGYAFDPTDVETADASDGDVETATAKRRVAKA